MLERWWWEQGRVVRLTIYSPLVRGWWWEMDDGHTHSSHMSHPILPICTYHRLVCFWMRDGWWTHPFFPHVTNPFFLYIPDSCFWGCDVIACISPCFSSGFGIITATYPSGVPSSSGLVINFLLISITNARTHERILKEDKPPCPWIEKKTMKHTCKKKEGKPQFPSQKQENTYENGNVKIIKIIQKKSKKKTKNITIKTKQT